MTTKPGSTTTTASSLLLTSSFSPAPVANQVSDYTLTLTNKTGKTVTVTSVKIDVGHGKLSATFTLAGESTPSSTTQDFLTYQLQWSGSLKIANSASAKITFPGAFIGIASTITFPSIIVSATPALSTATFTGPKITIK